MNRLSLRIAFCLFSWVVCCFSWAAENETPIEGRITSLGVFKNGILVVQEELSFPGPGRYVLESPPAPVHGTFFINGSSSVVVTSKLRSVTLPLDQVDDLDWSRDFAGKKVRVSLDKGEPFDAEICAQNTSDQKQKRHTPLSRSYSSVYPFVESGTTPGHKQILLKKSDGSILVIPDKSCVTSIELKDGTTSVVRKRPAVVFDVPGNKAKDSTPVTISLSYLTKGMTWAPAWKIDWESDNNINVTQTVLLVNQWRSFKNVSVFLISGYPQIAMSRVPSPLAPTVSMEYFFERLTASENKTDVPFANMAVQQVMSNAAASPVTDDEQNITSPHAGEGPDLVFQPVGKRSLEKDERLYLCPVSKQTSCKRLICWNIPDNRDEWGRNDESRRNRNNYGSTTSGEMSRTAFARFVEPWDVWEFVNPLEFPMTTGPASILNKSRFVGQTLSYWTSPGQKNSLAVNKALNILAESKEEEVTAEPASSKPKMSANTSDDLASNSDPTPAIKPSFGVPTSNSDTSRAGDSEAGVGAKITGTATGQDLFETIRQNAGVAILGNRLDWLTALPPGVDFKRVSTDSEGRATVVVNGRSYRIATVKATISLTNHRKEEVQSIIRRRFSGELVRNNPGTELSATVPVGKTVVLTDEQTGINRRHEISWNVAIASGEKKTISFFYQVLISL